MENLRFNRQDIERANDAWGFNCGPGALCAILGRKPDEIRPHLREFEQKGYTNPTLMTDILRGMGVVYRQIYRSDSPIPLDAILKNQPLKWIPDFGLIRLQWAGPWTRAGVPMKARYRKTHWIAGRRAEAGEAYDGYMIYDLNGDGWMPVVVWAEDVLPPLLREFAPQSEGQWWPTNTLEIQKP